GHPHGEGPGADPGFGGSTAPEDPGRLLRRAAHDQASGRGAGRKADQALSSRAGARACRADSLERDPAESRDDGEVLPGGSGPVPGGGVCLFTGEGGRPVAVGSGDDADIDPRNGAHGTARIAPARLVAAAWRPRGSFRGADPVYGLEQEGTV